MVAIFNPQIAGDREQGFEPKSMSLTQSSFCHTTPCPFLLLIPWGLQSLLARICVVRGQ